MDAKLKPFWIDSFNTIFVQLIYNRIKIYTFDFFHMFNISHVKIVFQDFFDDLFFTWIIKCNTSKFIGKIKHTILLEIC